MRHPPPRPWLSHPHYGPKEPSRGPSVLTFQDSCVLSPCPPQARFTLEVHQWECGRLFPGQGSLLGLAFRACPLQTSSLCPWLGENPDREGTELASQGSPGAEEHRVWG